jgi:hypothetical protein
MATQKEQLLEKLVEITVESNDQFLVIRETLTRIGIPNADNTEILYLPLQAPFVAKQ